jgi:hypothetical protein
MSDWVANCCAGAHGIPARLRWDFGPERPYPSGACGVRPRQSGGGAADGGTMTRGGYAPEAEQYLIEGWRAGRSRTPTPRAPTTRGSICSPVTRAAVPCGSTGGVRCDFGIGRSLTRYPAHLDGFVDLTVPEPWPVYLAGACTIERLALERHRQYQAERGHPVEPLNSWSPTIQPRIAPSHGDTGMLVVAGAGLSPPSSLLSRQACWPGHARTHHGREAGCTRRNDWMRP